MIDSATILSPATTRAGRTATGKKRALQDASEMLGAVHRSMNAGDIFDQLLARERLGSTELGEGVAIPHCHIEECSRALGASVTLMTPTDFDAPDGVPVDLIFVLVVPSEGREIHLQILAELARVFSAADNRARLRAATTDIDLYKTLPSMLHAAA